MGGKVLVPTREAVEKLTAARLAADVMGVPTLIVARTDAEAADLRNLRRTANFALAVDSVRDPVTNAPICRVALTVANSGCVPINLFGEGAPSQQIGRAHV